jgi:hypothetical protein
VPVAVWVAVAVWVTVAVTVPVVVVVPVVVWVPVTTWVDVEVNVTVTVWIVVPVAVPVVVSVTVTVWGDSWVSPERPPPSLDTNCPNCALLLASRPAPAGWSGGTFDWQPKAKAKRARTTTRRGVFIVILLMEAANRVQFVCELFSEGNEPGA